MAPPPLDQEKKQLKRAWHTKKRTACKTCKERRVRCDEQQPSCNRCTSTGRLCGGYASNFIYHDSSLMPSGSSQNGAKAISYLSPQLKPKSLLPSSNPEELRSFRYFLTKTAPALAGVFFTEFWFQGIPQACHTYPAIWHAAVSLGAADEGYNATSDKAAGSIAKHQRIQLALQQYSSSVKYLTDLAPRSSEIIDKKIALAASVLFAHVCSVQGLQNQAFIHIRGGLRLLQEIQAEEQRGSNPTNSMPKLSPVPLVAIQSILHNLSVQAEIFLGGKIDVGALSLAGSDSFDYWRGYQPPTYISLETTDALRSNIVRACKATESLFFTLAVYLGQRDVYQLLIDGNIAAVVRQQIPFKRTLQSLGLTLGTLESYNLPMPDKATVTVLRAIYMSCQTLIIPDPAKQTVDHQGNLKSHFTRIVDLASAVLENESDTNLASDADPDNPQFVPRPSVTQSLFLAAIAAPLAAIRQRAIELLETYPRHEGFWDSLIAAKIALNILQYKADCESSVATASLAMKLRKEARVTVEFQGERKVKLILRDFDEWSTGVGGRERLVEW